MGYHSALKRNEWLEATRRHEGNLTDRGRRQSEKATSCIIPATGHSGRGQTEQTVTRSVTEDSWREDDTQPGAFWRQWNDSCDTCDTIQWIRVFTHLFKPRQCATPRANPKVNVDLGWWGVNADSQAPNRCITSVQMLPAGEAVHTSGQGAREPPDFPLNSATNLQLLKELVYF